MSNYNWNKDYVDRNQKRLFKESRDKFRRYLNGVYARPEEEIKNRKEREEKVKEMAKTYNRMIINIHEKASIDELNSVIKIWEDTKQINKRNQQLKERAVGLIDFYKKYVNKSAKLTGCGSCIKAQMRFFEMLIDYHYNGQKTKR